MVPVFQFEYLLTGRIYEIIDIYFDSNNGQWWLYMKFLSHFFKAKVPLDLENKYGIDLFLTSKYMCKRQDGTWMFITQPVEENFTCEDTVEYMESSDEESDDDQDHYSTGCGIELSCIKKT